MLFGDNARDQLKFCATPHQSHSTMDSNAGAFVTSPTLSHAKRFFGSSQKSPVRNVKNSLLPHRRCVLPMVTMMSATSEGEEENTDLQGPSQAPTAGGISTAGLSDEDAKFITACYGADVEQIEKMVDEGQDPNIADVNRRSALHFCSGNGLTTVCQKLIQAGANLNAQDVLGFTPLHMATGYKKENTVRILVEAGADANITSLKGDLAVEIAENILENTPKKKFFMDNEEYSRMQKIVDILDKATETEEDDEEDDADNFVLTEDGVREVTEETESAKFVVRVKPKGEVSAPTTTDMSNTDVKVTIKVKEPEPKA